MSRLSVSSLLPLVLLVGALALAAPLPSMAGTVAESLSKEVQQVFEHCKGAVVKIEASDKTGSLCGTGFFIDPNGTLLTSFSVGGESRDFRVICEGNVKTSARFLVGCSRAGIAILKAENVSFCTPFLPLAKSSRLPVATPVVTIAYPMDMPMTPNFGMISGFDLKYLGRYFATTHIRASVPVQRGQGGAPLLNMQGEVLGVVISSIDNGSSCFAIPAEAVEKIHRNYERYGEVRPGWLGVVVCTAAHPSPKGSSAEIERLELNAPALKAGLHPGDILLKIGQTEIKSPQDVLDASFFLTAGEKSAVVVWRDGKELTFLAEPAEQSPTVPRVSGLQPMPGIPAACEDITLRPR